MVDWMGAMALRIQICAVGKLKERFWKEACQEYLKRLGPYADVRVLEVPDRDPASCGGDAQALEREGTDILKALDAVPVGSHVILLDIQGRERSSQDLSQHLDQLAVEGTSSLVFIIGGSLGVSQGVRERAQERLSFGPITLPHNLARVVLLEQLYRSFRISHGEPYHK